MGSIQNPLASIQGGKIGSWRNISKNSGVAKYISTQTYLHRRKDQNISPMLHYQRKQKICLVEIVLRVPPSRYGRVRLFSFRSFVNDPFFSIVKKIYNDLVRPQKYFVRFLTNKFVKKYVLKIRYSGNKR